MKNIETSELQLNRSTTIKRGDVIRLSVGKRHGPHHNGAAIYTMPGKWLVRAITARGKRKYLVVDGLDRAGTFNVFAAGSDYTKHGVRWKPYRVRKCK